MIRRFGDFQFHVERRTLVGPGGLVKLTGQAMDLLALMLERPGVLITRDEIQRTLWPDRTVEFDHSLDVAMARLRAALADNSRQPRYIETIPRKGYRFIEPVVDLASSRRGPAARPWLRRMVVFACVAILAAAVTLVAARSRYDRFVPHHGPVQPPPR